MKKSLEHLTVAAFQPRIGHRFRIRLHPESAIEAELIEARQLVDAGNPPAGKSRRRTPFSLLFRTSRATVLPQRIYEVEHDEMGSYSIFLVPVGPDTAGMTSGDIHVTQVGIRALRIPAGTAEGIGAPSSTPGSGLAGPAADQPRPENAGITREQGETEHATTRDDEAVRGIPMKGGWQRGRLRRDRGRDRHQTVPTARARPHPATPRGRH